MSGFFSKAMVVAAAMLTAACADEIMTVVVPPAPTNLSYRLEPSGDPARPRGVILRWEPVFNSGVTAYRIYSRAGTSGPFGLRGTTTSPSFHDDGVPHLEYFVTAEGSRGAESDASNSVLIDERLTLPAPQTLTSISLNAAIHLQWSDNSFRADPEGFGHYRVYSAKYDLDRNLCEASWSLEGTTVGSSFLVPNLTNGRPRCFGVSAISIEGFESLWSPLRNDTPRPDGRNVVVFTTASSTSQSGFRFWLDANSDGLVGALELGIVGAGGSTTMDFAVEQDQQAQIWIVPKRSAVTVRLYSASPVADLTSIDFAPAGGYARASLLAQPRFGYVFQMNEGDGFFRYGAIRVTAVGRDYVILDWSYQTDPGNPELVRVVR